MNQVIQLEGLGLAKVGIDDIEIYIEGRYYYLNPEQARETAHTLNEAADTIDGTSIINKLHRIISGLNKEEQSGMLELLKATSSGRVFEAVSVEGREG